MTALPTEQACAQVSCLDFPGFSSICLGLFSLPSSQDGILRSRPPLGLLTLRPCPSSPGDRLVKVNGESVIGKTYSQVIALIQNR